MSRPKRKVPPIVVPDLHGEVPSPDVNPEHYAAAIGDQIRLYYWDDPDREEWIVLSDKRLEFLTRFDRLGMPITTAAVIADLAAAGRRWANYLNADADGLEFIVMQAGGKLYTRWVGAHRVRNTPHADPAGMKLTEERILADEHLPEPVTTSPSYEIYT